MRKEGRQTLTCLHLAFMIFPVLISAQYIARYDISVPRRASHLHKCSVAYWFSFGLKLASCWVPAACQPLTFTAPVGTLAKPTIKPHLSADSQLLPTTIPLCKDFGLPVLQKASYFPISQQLYTQGNKILETSSTSFFSLGCSISYHSPFAHHGDMGCYQRSDCECQSLSAHRATQ